LFIFLFQILSSYREKAPYKSMPQRMAIKMPYSYAEQGIKNNLILKFSWIFFGIFGIFSIRNKKPLIVALKMLSFDQFTESSSCVDVSVCLFGNCENI
jgi:hypothetical protein